jgi:hypothetical protein
MPHPEGEQKGAPFGRNSRPRDTLMKEKAAPDVALFLKVRNLPPEAGKGCK